MTAYIMIYTMILDWANYAFKLGIRSTMSLLYINQGGLFLSFSSREASCFCFFFAFFCFFFSNMVRLLNEKESNNDGAAKCSCFLAAT